MVMDAYIQAQAFGTEFNCKSAMELQHLESRNKSVNISVRAQHPLHSQTETGNAMYLRTTNDATNEETPHSSEVETLTFVKRRNERPLSRLHFLTLCWTLFLIGWNDGSTGPLIPRIREFYGVEMPASHFSPLMADQSFLRWDLWWYL